MVSEDSTSRVMVLPVTAKLLVDVGDEVAPYLGAEIRDQLTGLDEDLHLDYVLVCMSVSVDEESW
jgi:hypothetical protein